MCKKEMFLRGMRRKAEYDKTLHFYSQGTFNRFVNGTAIRPTFELGLIQRKSGR